MHVLIVDDEKDIRDTLRDLFEDEGHTVTLAEDGARALERLRDRDDWAVVILDLVMPVLTGNEVYEAMRSDPQLAEVPVLITTSDPSRAPRGVPLLRKPLHLQRVLDAVADLAVLERTRE